MARRTLAIGFSGGGDSTALLLAARTAYPQADIFAFIVDHGLRADSRAEAELAADRAGAAGAKPVMLRWRSPRNGQARAREARHRLLACAAKRAGADVLCLGHTLDDRIETLRMRAARSGPDSRMAGPSPLDPSPIWPDGAGLVIARPLLALSRAELRSYLDQLGASWIEDPSNENPDYERVRLRASPIAATKAAGLLARSDAARAHAQALNARALALIETAARLEPWGGARLDSHGFGRAERAVALKALEALVLAVGGRASPPTPASLGGMLDALNRSQAASCCGAHLTQAGVLGRDAGAAGRADGTAGPESLDLAAGETQIFDGRFRIRAGRPLSIKLHGARRNIGGLGLPPALRPGLVAIHDHETGARLGLAGVDQIDGVEVELMSEARMRARLLPPKPPTWFDGVKIAAQVRVTLANPARRPNMKRDAIGSAPVQAALDASRGKEETR